MIWVHSAYRALYLTECDQKIIQDRCSRTSEGQLCISRHNVTTVGALRLIYHTRWRRAMRAFYCISSEMERILGTGKHGGIIPNPEDPSDSLLSKCTKILECWHEVAGCEASDCFIQPCTNSIRSRQKDLFDRRYRFISRQPVNRVMPDLVNTKY